MVQKLGFCVGARKPGILPTQTRGGNLAVIRLIQIDGKLPNLALMRLSAWHKEQGDTVIFTRSVSQGLFDPEPDVVYASTIFKFSHPKVSRMRQEYPDAIIGGTGYDVPQSMDFYVPRQFKGLDYSIYPDFTGSLGFTQRGCRLKCKFCVVPTKEGKPESVASVYDIWRGEGYAKQLHLLDNDFFGQPEDQWRARLNEVRIGGFKICLNQGINIRLFDDAAAEELATVEYRDDSFTQRRLYTAWDNLKDEKRFFSGVDKLARAGIPPKHLMVYMLVGFDPKETWDRIHYRFDKMVEMGCYPYPMVFDDAGKNNSLDRRRLKQFQRWAVTGLYRAAPFSEYDPSRKSGSGPPDQQINFLEV